MAEIASVARFCAIEGKECEKLIPYLGSDTFFLAYPGGPYWNDFTQRLTEEMQERGIVADRWEDIVANDLLFSKVCDGIHSHDYLLAEVSEPNANVLMEIGYALAVGRLPILLQNKNRSDWSRRLLTTLESCRYENREDIHAYLGRLLSGTRTIPEQPDRRLPFLENMGIYDREEVPGTVYHLKPRAASDWVRGVDRVLKKSYFKMTAMDPSDSTYDEFYPQAREIQGASLIVASMVNTKQMGWQEQNAHLALLVGFAIGLGKQVLVLQEEALAPILDLGSMSHPFTTESQAEQIVESWIHVHTRSIVSQNVETRRIARVRRQANRMRSLYLGHPDALQDNNLLDYYVPTKEFEDAVRGQRSLFIGRRGSGKSANFRAVSEELRTGSNIVVAHIAPDDFEFERLSSYLEREYSTTDHRLTFQNAWNFIVLTELLKALAEETDLLYSSPDNATKSRLRNYYEAHRDTLSLDFGTRVNLTLMAETNSSGVGQDSSKVSNTETAIKSLREYDIGRHLKKFAEDEGITYFVLADDLDKHWRPDTKQAIDLLVGLIAEADKMQRFFGGTLKAVMFLREDIYEVLALYDDDLPKRSLLRLEWTESNLKHLVAERLSASISQENEDDDSTWEMVFPDTVRGIPPAQFILRRALPRPRDVLDFCQKAIDQAQRNGHSHVTEQDIVDGETTFSEALFWSVCAEFRGLYPGLENVLIEFAGVPERLSWDEFERFATKAIEANEESVDKWSRFPSKDAISLAEVLFKVGVLGLSGSHTTAPLFRNGRSFAETWVAVSAHPFVCIHPGFARSLDVSNANPIRPQQRRRPVTVDPRQLPLE